MAPSYKLVYFDARGAAESIRFLFTYGGIDYEDCRIKKENWPQIKNDTPFGQLPYLEYNGKRYNQSHAIARYLAKLVNLTGKNDLENLEIDAVVDSISDLRNKFVAVRHETDEARKKTLQENLLKNVLPFYFGKLDALAKKNGGFLAVGRLSLADICFVSGCTTMERYIGSDLLDKYPNLIALRDQIYAIPSIKKWIEVRPDTEN